MNMFVKVVWGTVLFSYFLFASFIQEFQVKIEDFFQSFHESQVVVSTYSKEDGLMEYQGTTSTHSSSSTPLWQTIQSFDNIDNNSSQKELKDEFEQLIPYYFRADNIFSKEECKTNVYTGGKALKYNDFFRILSLYTLYLKEHPSRGNQEKYRQIIDTTLRNLHSLMQNSDNLVDYMFSVIHMKRVLYQVNYEDMFVEVIKKYPPLSNKILFKKLELEKKRTLLMWRETEQQGADELGFSKKRMKIFKDEVAIEFKKILDKAYSLEIIAIKDGTATSLERYKKYVDEITYREKEKGVGDFLEYKASIYTIRVLDFLGIESEFRGTTTESTLNILSAMILPLGGEINKETYQSHKELIERYEWLLKNFQLY